MVVVREFVFIPQKTAHRLREFTLQVCNATRDRIFPISDEAARMVVIKSGNLEVSTHDPMTCGGIPIPARRV